MSLDMRKIEIKEKIKIGNLSFNNVEKYIIGNNIELQLLFVKKCENYEYMSKDIFESIIDGTTFLSDDVLLSSQMFIRNLALIAIEIGRLENIDEFLGILADNESVLSALSLKLNDPNYILATNIGSISVVVINLIIEKNRTDIIQEIDFSKASFNGEVRDLLINYINKNPNVISLKNLIHFQKEEIKVDFDIFEMALSKIRQLEFVDQSLNCNYLFNLCPDNQKEMLFELLISKSHVCLDYLFSNKNDTSQYEKLIKINLEKGSEFYLSPAISTTYTANIIREIKDRDIFWDFIQNGQLDLFYDYNIFSAPDDIRKIIEIISSNPGKFKKHFEYSRLPIEITTELIKIQDYSIDFIQNFSYDADKYIEPIKEKIRKGHKFNLPDFMLKKEIVDIAIETENIGCLFGSINNVANNLKKLDDYQIANILETLSKREELKLTVFEKIKREIHNNPILLAFYMEDDIYIEEILNIVQHTEGYEKYYTSEIYNASKKYLSSKYNLNINHMDILVSNYGYLLIHYIENKSIQKIINMDDSEFNKIISIFPSVNFEMKDAEAIYDSLRQHEFSTKKGDILNIFNRIIVAIEEHDNNVFQDFQLLANEFNEKLYKKIAEDYPQFQHLPSQNLKEFFILIKDKIEYGNIDEQNMYRNILHVLTTHYIAMQREKWRKENSFEDFKKNQLSYHFEEKDLEKIKIITCLKYLIDKNDIYLEKLCQNIGIDYDTLMIIYRIYIGEINLNTLEISKEKRSELSKLIGKTINGTKNFMDNEMPQDYKETTDIVIKAIKVDSTGCVSIDAIDNNSINKSIYMIAFQTLTEFPPRKSYYVNADYNLIYFIMSNLQVEIMKEHLLSNFEIIQSLNTIMSKSKLHICPDNLKNLRDDQYELILQDGFDGISAFITYFYKIYEEEIEKAKVLGKESNEINLSIANILKKAEAYGAKSSIYAQILGGQDARLIKSNPGPNSAYNNVENRLDNAVDWTINLFKRQEVTIPTFKKDFLISGEKKINVTVGNFKNSCNLTHGERTGACMRIGGAGETFFKFCLENINGFHIVFSDSEEKKYISRVSGFRNGNTVFLNQLRSSCIDKYSDSDLVKIIEEVARELITMSAESDMPICNVVIHNSYAMSGSEKELTNFNIRNNKVGLPYFYSDISASGIVLATNRSDNELVPIDFTKREIPSYSPVRDAVISSDNMEQLQENIGRIYTVKKMLDGIDWRYIEMLEFNSGIKYGFAGEDWYAYIDNSGLLYEEIIDIDKRAREELEMAKKLLKESISVKEDIYVK